MTDIEAINREAQRRFVEQHRTWTLLPIPEMFDAYSNIRDELIKEGWTPTIDLAEALHDDLFFAGTRSEENMRLIRAALSKAREHPADVVEAAKRCQNGYDVSKDTRDVANYILKDLP